jgi:hypothetical protein
MIQADVAVAVLITRIGQGITVGRVQLYMYQRLSCLELYSS